MSLFSYFWWRGYIWGASFGGRGIYMGYFFSTFNRLNDSMWEIVSVVTFLRDIKQFTPIFHLHTLWKRQKIWLISLLDLTLSWRRPISYRNQSIDLLCKSMDWFLYDIDLLHERVKVDFTISFHDYKRQININLPMKPDPNSVTR